MLIVFIATDLHRYKMLDEAHNIISKEERERERERFTPTKATIEFNLNL